MRLLWGKRPPREDVCTYCIRHRAEETRWSVRAHPPEAQGPKDRRMVRTIKGPGMLPSRDPFRSVLLVRPFFHLFRYKIDFVCPCLRFLQDFVCSYALLFFRSKFVSFFLVPGPPEGCKCSQITVLSFKIKVSSFSFFSDVSLLWDLSGTPSGALLVTIGASGGPLGDPWRQNGVPRAAAKSV